VWRDSGSPSITTNSIFTHQSMLETNADIARQFVREKARVGNAMLLTARRSIKSNSSHLRAAGFQSIPAGSRLQIFQTELRDSATRVTGKPLI
jgi:hypothetical protein